MKIETSKIPEIVSSVMRNIKEHADLFKIDVYVHMLSRLSDKECYFLFTNRSNEFYENDLDFLIDTLKSALKLYEENEEYEICQEIFTSIDIYSKFFKT